MAPYEYRICAVPDPSEELTWVVKVYLRRFSADPDETGWRCVLTVDHKEKWAGDRPAKYFKLIARCLSKLA
jgi:hypothetical protein